jgi:hypothetical protein
VITFIEGLSPGWQNNICPVVASIRRSAPNPTSSTTVRFAVTFSRSVTGVNLLAPFNDFALTTTGITGASIASISGSQDAYTVTVDTGSGPGTLRLDVLDDNTIFDAVSHALGGIEAGDGNFKDGETYTIWGFKDASRWTTAFDLSHGWTVSQYARTR